jgi:hypothetical protein
MNAASTGWVADVLTTGELGKWRSVTALDLSTNNCGAAATSSHVYISGGFASIRYDYLRAAPIAPDGSLGAWAALASLIHGRSTFALTIAGDHIYALGGIGTSGEWLASVEVADLQPDGSVSSWRETAALPIGLAGHSAVSFLAPR